MYAIDSVSMPSNSVAAPTSNRVRTCHRETGIRSRRARTWFDVSNRGAGYQMSAKTDFPRFLDQPVARSAQRFEQQLIGPVLPARAMFSLASSSSRVPDVA